MELDHEEEVPYLPMNEDQFLQAKQSMNAGQKEIFTLVTQSIQNQMLGAEERLKKFFTGGAGVGKTFLLKLIRDQINRCYAKDAVKVCSLTGVAARLINGATIHSTLKLPVQKDGRITGMSPLSGNYLRIMRQQWHQTEFLIVDEISMVSYQMLCMMDARLRQIKNCENEFFGGVNVLLFGDLLQLPPIKRFKQPEHLQPATHLWRLFTLCELTENMRQQGDQTFIDILNALRVGELTTQHFSILMGRLLQDTSDEFAIDKALRVYPTNQQVNDHNSAVLNLYRNNGARIYKIKRRIS
ncbi:ATP-dependent DNA helicase RRM3 [Eumeta japonica]|uniref:ATP-dependent DNA helicase n=1 Tax=Eumeta variegata TaxID=151549 RepID=A0A4C1UK97_EUMVA|nr:ATP-dependent DNA helicase RRM3 [Eumeta japonica]